MFITKTSHHSEFAHIAEHLNNLQIKYETIRDDAYLVRMKMIGICEDYKRQFKQRSSEADYIQKGYDANGWKPNVVSRSYKAYQLKQELLDNCNHEFVAAAKLATYSQLVELTGDNDKATIHHAAMYLKKNGYLPTSKEIRGHKAGHFTDDFESKAALRAANRTDDDEPKEPKHLPDQPQHERIVTDHEKRQAELIVNGVQHVEPESKVGNFPLETDSTVPAPALKEYPPSWNYKIKTAKAQLESLIRLKQKHGHLFDDEQSAFFQRI